MVDPSQYIAAIEAVMRDRDYRKPRFTPDGLTHSSGVVDEAVEIACILGNADILIEIVTGVWCDLGAQYLERLHIDDPRGAYQTVKNHAHRHVNLSPECVDDFRTMISAANADDNQS